MLRRTGPDWSYARNYICDPRPEPFFSWLKSLKHCLKKNSIKEKQINNFNKKNQPKNGKQIYKKIF